MQIEVKELEPCKLLINYEADAGQILDKRAEVLTHFKKAPVPGFRPGKASIESIKVHYRDQIEQSLKRALVEDAYHNTLFEKKMKPHGAPKINSAMLIGGKFNCEFEMLTKPEFTLAEYKGMELVKPPYPNTVTELTEDILQELRTRFSTAEPFAEDDFVQKNDNIIIDYEGSVNGEKLDNLSAVGETLTVGASKLPNFDDNLLGMKLGETREFFLVVPPEGLPSLAGKTVSFKVTLIIGSKLVPCPLDDALAEKVGKKDFSEVRELAQGLAMAKIQESERQLLIQAASAKLVSLNEINVPNWISLSEAQYLAHQSRLVWDKLEDNDKELYLKLAEKNTKLTLILDKIRDDEPEAQLSDQEVFDMIRQKIVSSNPKEPIDNIINNMNQTGYMQILFSRIKDEYTLDFVLKSVKVIE